MSLRDTLDLQVRWGDLDAFNHVNNTLFLRYVEEARIHLFRNIEGEWENAEAGPVVVNLNCNFRREIRYPATVRVLTEAVQASDKRMVMHHRLVDAEDEERHYADAEVTAVWVSKKGGGSIPLPSVVRDVLA
jgi:acyl-CoA thioester hydrolase